MTGRTRKAPSGAIKELQNGGYARPTSTALATRVAQPMERTSTLPRSVQFPLLVTLNFTFIYFLYLLGAEFTHYELSAVSKQTRSDGDLMRVVAVLAWRIAEMALGWFGGYDGMHWSIDNGVFKLR